MDDLEGYNRTTCQQDKAGISFFEAIASATGGIIGLTNMVVVVVILGGGRKLRKATFFCICNLAVADMLAGILLLWIFGLQKIVLPFRTPLSELLQKTIWAVTVWSSMFNQLVIAIDRYSRVTRRKRESNQGPRNRGSFKWKNKSRQRLVKVGIAFTWLVPILTFVAPVTSFWNCAHSCPCYKQENSTSDVYYMICHPTSYCSFTNPPFTKGSMLYLGLSLLVMPAVPCILYVRIYHFVSNSAKKMKSQYSRPSSSNSADHDSRSVPRGGRCNSQNDAAGRSNGRIIRTLPISPFPSSDEAQFLCENSNFTAKPGTKVDKKSQKRWSVFSQFLRQNGSPVNNNSRSGRLKQFFTTSSSLSKTIAKFRQQRELRLLRTLIIILGILIISTVPLGVLFVVSFFETDKRFVGAAKVLLTVSLLNSLINPWVYFWRFMEMRTALRKMFCGSC